MISFIKKVWQNRSDEKPNFISEEQFKQLKPMKNKQSLKDYVEALPEKERKEAIARYKNKFS